MRRTLKHSLLASIGLATVLASAMVVISPWLITLWIGHAIEASLPLLLGLGLWKVIEPGGMALGVFLNGAHMVRLQVIFSVVTATIAIFLKIILVGQIGVSGVVWATIISYLLFTVLPFGIILPKILSKGWSGHS